MGPWVDHPPNPLKKSECSGSQSDPGGPLCTTITGRLSENHHAELRSVPLQGYVMKDTAPGQKRVKNAETGPSSEESPRSPSPTGKERIIVRFSGDITTKSAPTRKRFLTRMSRNIKNALSTASIENRVSRTHTRIFVDIDSDRIDAALQLVSHIFGVQSASRVEERKWNDADDIVTAGREIFLESVRNKVFAVRAKRVGNRNAIPIDSTYVERELGSELLKSARKVSLKNPEAIAAIEILADQAHFFSHTVQSPGGLPLGCEGRAVALVSGGFDSPVAAWLLNKRGVELDYVFCNLGGRTHQLETLQVMKVMADQWSYGTRPHFHAIEFEEVTRDLQAGVTTRYWQIILKRLMMRAAEVIARERDASAIVTGEAVGQVSSQTLPNLAVISQATSLPILRPLIGYNKDEIIALARKIGTHDLSSKVGEYCALVPSRPATRATQKRIEAEEMALDPKILDRAIAERSIFDLRALDLESLDRPEIQTEKINETDTVIDLRSKNAYENWHYPKALFLEFQDAMKAYPHMDHEKRYVLYCEFGLKSGHLAELMRREGLNASHFVGGLKAITQYTKQTGAEEP